MWYGKNLRSLQNRLLELNFDHMELIANAISVKGRGHIRNEDSFFCSDNYYVIADGMGGEACGEVASKIAINTISSLMDRFLDERCSENNVRNLAFYAISNADKEILKYASANPDADGMGTTILLLIHFDRNVYVAWCGDSHCFFFDSSKKLHSLTSDHSYVRQLIDQHKISIEDAFTHPDNNLITRYVGGGEETCRPEFVSSTIDNDEVLILCSDGLSGYCRSEEIEQQIQSSPFNDISHNLMKLAISNGSDDDITIVSLTPKQNRICRKNITFAWLRKIRNFISRSNYANP